MAVASHRGSSRRSRRRLPGVWTSCSYSGGSHSTNSTPTDTTSITSPRRPSPRGNGRSRSPIAHQTAPTRRTATGAAYPMCVCTQNVPTPHATGSAQRSPHVAAHTSMRKAPNGNTVMNGFHGSARKSLGNVTVSSAMPSVDRRGQRQATPASGQDHDHGDRRRVHEQRTHEHRGAVRSEDPVRERHQVGEGRAGVAQPWRENGPSRTSGCRRRAP